MISALSAQTVTGELRQWHNVTVTLDGPSTSETATPNPFLDYRLNFTFTNGTRTYVVPGYYAADGNAEDSSATSGNKWRVHFVPDAQGTWKYSVSFRSGANIAVSDDPNSGTPVSPNGITGTLNVAASDKTGRDLRGKGFLRYVNQRYYRFSGSGEYFLKGGANSPENLLAYVGFDGTTAKHSYNAHTNDWRTGDPLWKNGKMGRNLIGAMNYLATKGMNSAHFIAMTVNGDGKDVWPWTSSAERYRYDVSKLAQWDVVMSHMDKLGLAIHLTTQERENDQLLDGGALGTQRKLYYRELVARFGHHLGLVWNLGEENSNTDAQRKAFGTCIRSIDPYDHPIAAHTYPTELDLVYTPLLGHEAVDAASLQIGHVTNVHSAATKWIAQSAQAGRPWVVTLDEIGPAGAGVAPDSVDPKHDTVRRHALWGTLMAGGAGVEWYFGYNYAHNDLNAEDFRSRDKVWDQTRYALEFFEQLPFESMTAANHLTASTSDWVFAKAGQVYVVYLPWGGSATLDLGPAANTYSVRWFNPRSGAPVAGSVSSVTGPGVRSIGSSPDTAGDWVALVQAGAAPSGPSYTLSVTDGTGSGSHPAGTTIAISAKTAPAGQVFDRWTGADGHLDNVSSPTARLTMPAASVSVKATYKTGTHSTTSVAALVLINADTNQPIAGFNPIPDGATLNLATLPTKRLNVQAVTNPSVIGSVRFRLNGSVHRTESTAPFALAGDTSGDYLPWTPTLGQLTISATPYTEASAAGTAGPSMTVRLNVVNVAEAAAAPASFTLTVNSGTGTGLYAPGTAVAITAAAAPAGQVFDRWMGAAVANPYGASTTLSMPSANATVSATYKAVTAPSRIAVTRLVLINADTDQPIPGYTQLTDGMTISLSALPTRNLNVQAITNPPAVGCVKFDVIGGSNLTENVAPYAMAGDTNGNYKAWTPATGTVNITATPFTGTNGSGTMGDSLTVRLYITR